MYVPHVSTWNMWYQLRDVADERRTILYSGRVQGVGFRWSVQSELRGIELTGYVRNLPDGRVELVLEGSPEATADGVARITARMGHHIGNHREEVGPATGEFPDFRITR